MPRVDPKMRPLVAELNRVPGVTTSASCEGGGRSGHGTLAYVRFRTILPPAFADAIAASPHARVEDFGVYACHETRNAAFVEALETATRSYLRRREASVVGTRSYRLADLLRQLRGPADSPRFLCLPCGSFEAPDHGHGPMLVLPMLGDRVEDETFARFLESPENSLPPDLRARETLGELRRRAKEGDFGRAFLSRWERFRKAELDMRVRRSLVAAVRRERTDPLAPVPNVYFRGKTAVFEW
ncbi:MAG: hypothetical protein KatS3mg076_1161 [Candidatus Binatia bacterium]|nr:MAG: hypothetical protein KatS3mg076_1161 [Candidatus Binatia bacterium]